MEQLRQHVAEIDNRLRRFESEMLKSLTTIVQKASETSREETNLVRDLLRKSHVAKNGSWFEVVFKALAGTVVPVGYFLIGVSNRLSVIEATTVTRHELAERIASVDHAIVGEVAGFGAKLDAIRDALSKMGERLARIEGGK